jgi:gas vesicle protein GvpG
MSLLSEVLLAPLAPARLALWSIDRVVDRAEQDFHNPAVIHRELAALARQLDNGVIDGDEFDRREDELLDRLAEGRRRQVSG